MAKLCSALVVICTNMSCVIFKEIYAFVRRVNFVQYRHNIFQSHVKREFKFSQHIILISLEILKRVKLFSYSHFDVIAMRPYIIVVNGADPIYIFRRRNV